MRLFSALFLLSVTATLAAAPPNVVIFLADDAGWGDYSHSGNAQVQTPHIDEITLPAGQSPLALRALEIPGKSVMDLRRITLTLRD